MSLKKIVFVIVEGPSEDDALGLFLRRLFKDDEVMVHIMKGDITVKSGAKQNIKEDIIGFMNNNYLEESDFKEIIHIVDTDGAYIPDDRIIQDNNINHIRYCKASIRAKEKTNIIIRNQKKRKNLNSLIKCDQIDGIPYSVYYMSCNLDHVLYNKANNKDRNKVDNAHMIAKRFLDREDEYKEFFLTEKFAVVDGYKDSWKFIRQGCHSVERHSNFGLCFK